MLHPSPRSDNLRSFFDAIRSPEVVLVVASATGAANVPKAKAATSTAVNRILIVRSRMKINLPTTTRR